AGDAEGRRVGALGAQLDRVALRERRIGELGVRGRGVAAVDRLDRHVSGRVRRVLQPAQGDGARAGRLDVGLAHVFVDTHVLPAAGIAEGDARLHQLAAALLDIEVPGDLFRHDARIDGAADLGVAGAGGRAAARGRGRDQAQGEGAHLRVA